MYLHGRAGKLASLLYIYIYIYKAEKPSVCLSAFCCRVDISAMAAWIDVRLARCDSYVFWHDEVYF